VRTQRRTGRRSPRKDAQKRLEGLPKRDQRRLLPLMVAWLAATEPEEHYGLEHQLAHLHAWLEAIPSEHERFPLESGARFKAPWWAFHFPDAPADGLVGLFTRPRTWEEYRLPPPTESTWWQQPPPSLFFAAAQSLNLEVGDLFKNHTQDGMWLYFRGGVPVWMVGARPANAPTPAEVAHVYPDLAAQSLTRDVRPLARRDPDFLRIFGPIIRRNALAQADW
jgi:hypothetical protein